jgi:hypothetical protein
MLGSTGFNQYQQNGGAKNNMANIDLLARKRQWEKEKRGTLISADAS